MTRMKTFSFLWTAKLGTEIARAAPKAGYHMSLVAEDRQKVIAAVNQGIDAYLEGCFVPGRDDSFRFQTPEGIRERISGARLECKVCIRSEEHTSELQS